MRVLLLLCVCLAMPAVVLAGPIVVEEGRVEDWQVRDLGIEILDAPVVGEQPVGWYGQRAILSLKAEPARRLPLAGLVQLTGATYRPVPVTAGEATPQVQLDLPPARIVQVRRAERPDGERLVIELDRPAFYQIERDATGEVRLVIDAAPMANTVDSRTGPALQSVRLISGEQSTVIAMAPQPVSFPTITTLGAPARLVVDWHILGREEQVQAWGEGLLYRRLQLIWEGRPRRVDILELTPGTPGLRWGVLRADTSTSAVLPLSIMAQRQGAWAAVNGGFFNRDLGEALGVVRSQGTWLGGPVAGLSARGAVGWSDKGEVRFDRLEWRGTVQLGEQRFTFGALNNTQAGVPVAVYTPVWGPTYQTRTGLETVAVVRDGLIQSVQTAVPGQPMLVPIDGWLLVIRQGAVGQVRLSAGMTATYQIDSQAFADLPNVLAAGPLLIQQGQVVLDADKEQFRPDVRADNVARTVVARRGEQVLLAVVNRQPGAVGMSLEALTRFLVDQLKTSDALNLDGGGSSGLYLGGYLRDRARGVFERPVANGLGV
ncbi:MAG: phosphodiester glycosidase family protein, partial [Gemmatimonadaceae bacterium]|nr:phosphodiester glycosidase family protein [Gloeobacterales cyanobacterium ES-bin-141]